MPRHCNMAQQQSQESPTSLRIQVVSDLHIEFYGSLDQIPGDLIIPSAPILALLGDVGLACTDLLEAFLHRQADRFERVLFVPGNHEYYNHHGDRKKTVQEQNAWMRQVCAARDNLHFMNEDSMLLGGKVRILAATLWSAIPTAQQQRKVRSLMNDYQLCWIATTATTKGENGEIISRQKKVRLAPQHTHQWHLRSVEWLAREIAAAQARAETIVVLTHHTPSLEGTANPIYQEDKEGCNCCFSTDLAHLLLQPPVAAWACGHTHWNFDRKLRPKNGGAGVRLCSNQRGYPGHESMAYDNEGLIIEVACEQPRTK